MPHEPIRVALVITELAVGGAERCLVNLATGLDRRRFAPHVISLGPRPAAPHDELVRKLAEADLPTTFLDARGVRSAPQTLWRLRSLLRQIRPHVLQTMLFHANVLGSAAGRAAAIPAICTGVRVADPRRWRWQMEAALERRAARVVCVSRAVADWRRRVVGAPAEKLVVIPNGIDVARYRNCEPADLTPFGVPAGAKAMVCVGRLDRQKGLDLLLDQAPRIFADLPEFHLLLVGDGPERERLQTLARRQGVAERVHFALWQGNVPGILKASEMLALPSRWEGMPNVVLEAMAAGLPVVASEVEGVVELLGEEADAQTAPPGNGSRLAERLVDFGRNRHLRSDLGKANLRRAAECFSLESMVEQYASLFARLARE